MAGAGSEPPLSVALSRVRECMCEEHRGRASALVDATFAHVYPPDPADRGAMLRKGIGALVAGGTLIAIGFGSLFWSPEVARYVGPRLFVPGGLTLGGAAWYLLRAWRPEKPLVLEQSECWECSERIRSAGEGLVCERCDHPIHARCKQRHFRVAHPTA